MIKKKYYIVFLLYMMIAYGLSGQIVGGLKFNFYCRNQCIINDSNSGAYFLSTSIESHDSALESPNNINCKVLREKVQFSSFYTGSYYGISGGGNKAPIRYYFTNSKDTMIVDFIEIPQYGIFFDSIMFTPGYFIIDIGTWSYWLPKGADVSTPKYKIYRFMKDNANSVPWLKKYKLTDYKKLITPCAK